MKHLKSKIVDDILSIIPNHPATRIIHISDAEKDFIGEDILTQKILDLSLKEEYDFLLYLLDKKDLDSYINKFKITGISSVKPLDIKRPRYAIGGRLYDFVYLTAKIQEDLIDEFIQKIYKIIKSSGLIIILLDKDINQNLQDWYSVLEDNYFVAINTIDISQNFHILVAKKMHGWGG